MYLTVYMCLHLVATIAIFVLPKILRAEKRSNSSTMASTEQTTRTQLTSTKKYESVDVSDKLAVSAILINNEIKTTVTANGTNSLDKINIKVNGLIDNNDNTNILRSNQVLGVGCGSRPPPLDKDNLSFIIREKFDSETRNIENFIDKTVTGIVELKDDLMKRQSDNNLNIFMKHQQDYGVGIQTINDLQTNGMRKRVTGNGTISNGEHFIQKELDHLNGTVRHQATVVLPAVISNGQAK